MTGGRLLRVGLLAVVALVLAVVIAGVAFVATFDPNSLKPRIVAAVQSATGRELSIGGKLGLSLFPAPAIAADDVTFANMPGGSRPAMATLGQLRATVSLNGLLGGRVVFDRLVLVKPDILLETDKQGRPNWIFTPPAKTPSATPPAPATPAQSTDVNRIAVNAVGIEDGRVTWRDGATGQAETIGIPRLDATEAASDQPINLTADLLARGQTVAVKAELPGLARVLHGGGATSFPAKVRLQSANDIADIDGTFDAAGAKAAGFFGFTGKATVNFADSSTLATMLPGGAASTPPLRGLHVAFTVPTGSATAHLDGSGSLRDGPFKLSTDIARSEPDAVSLSAMHLVTQFADVTGAIRFGLAARPSVQATLAAERLDIDAARAAFAPPAPPSVAAPPAAPTPAPIPAPAAAPPPRPVAATLIPDQPIPLDALRALDADVTMTAKDVKVSGTDAKDLRAHVVLAGGKLRLDPGHAVMPGGAADLALTVDASRAGAPPAVTVDLRAPDLNAATLTSGLFGIPQPVAGRAQLMASLSGQGDSPHAVLSTADGRIGFAMSGGSIDNRLMSQVLGDAGHTLGLTTLLPPGGRNNLDCAALRVDLRRGDGAVRALRLETALATMEGTGGLNFAQETMDLHLRALARIARTGVSVPLTIGGPWRHPGVTVNAAAAAEQTGAAALAGRTRNSPVAGIIIGALGQATGAAGGDNGNCASALALARNEAAPSAPAAPGPATPPASAAPAPAPAPAPAQAPAAPGKSAKPPKPADLLKNLFR